MSDGRPIVGIIQARMGSRRLPGKVLADLGGRPLLEQLIRRVKSSSLVDVWVIATSDLPQDDAIASLAEANNVIVHRGSEEDVLDRYYQAAKRSKAEVVVRLTADNPLVDGAIIDECVAEFLEEPCDYLDTMTSGTYPYGLSVEVFTSKSLAESWARETSVEGREHVTTYIRRAPHFVRAHKASPRNYANLRWTVDTPHDLESIRELFRRFKLDIRAIHYERLAALARERCSR